MEDRTAPGAGSSSRARARRARDDLEPQLAMVRRYHAGAVGEEAVRQALDPLTDRGWALLADRQWPGSSANIDMILVGPVGVVVIDAKNWRVAPTVVAGRLMRGDDRCDGEVVRLTRATEAVEKALTEMGLTTAAVIAAMIFVRHGVEDRVGRVHLLGAREAAARFARWGSRFGPEDISAVAARLAEVFPPYPVETPPELPRGSPAGPEAGLSGLELLALVDARARAALSGPIERWMTFIRPDQHDLVFQRWSGPARVSGPAGTGKTVVALHRAAFLAQRADGPVLYTSFVRTLPAVAGTLFHQLAPTEVGRVHFVHLHAWAARLLAERGQPIRPDSCDDCFREAWGRSGRRLATIESREHYWREEIDYVIKGRGIASFDEYRTVERHGRRTPLPEEHRAAVWALYLEYERVRRERGKHDYADLILAALAELRRQPLARAYGSVIVDEVQDLTLAGVRLLHALVGDAPDGLFLVGDGQQKVYPGGFKLADAGINVRGRSRVLKHNYRNGSRILERALQYLAGAAYEDIDDAEPDRGPVTTSDRTGEVVDVVRSTWARVDEELVAAIARLGDGPAHRGSTAVLCAGTENVERYRTLLARSGVEAQPLADYDGHTTSAVKVGTYKRAKGLEFTHVFLPRYGVARRPDRAGNAHPPRVADRDWAEQRRNEVFVAMTRARDTLWLGSLAPRVPG
jgi:superfamily I DNA/RNA helicase